MSILFLIMGVLTGLLYRYRTAGIEKNLSKILYYDYKRFSKDMRPEDYFTNNHQLKEIPTNPPLTVENRIQTHNGITTDRQNCEDDNILQLKENKVADGTTDRENVKMDNLTNTRVGGSEELIASSCISKSISIPDYAELTPLELIKYDKRSTLTYFKDMMILNHKVLSLIFKRSLKAPLFIEMLKLVFSLSMLFAVNAMVYTDDVIDKRQVDMKDVRFLFI
jgi:hypothetical protein